MKHSKFVLGATAAIVALASTFAFSSPKKFGAGTLYTANSGQFKVNCHRGTSGTACPAITYYTLPLKGGTKVKTNVFTSIS
jgi:hypothetical protein